MMHQFTYEALRFETNRLFASIGRIVERRITPKIYTNVPLAVLSESIRLECLRLGFDAQNVVSIPPGIEYNSYAVDSNPDSVLRILYIGRLARYKGVQYLIQATAQVLRKFPNAILDIVGRGYFEPNLKQLARQLRLNEHVEFHGLVDEGTKLDLLQRSWMLLMPSVQEGWGIPVLEAAAAGLPAIGTNTTGLRDSIVHGSTGLLVPFGDSPAIADAIIRLAQDSELRRTYGVNARRRARNFDWSLQLPKYSSFLLDEWMHCA
jgi:glycosyltransferase involved in cell wall biosynthesis